MTRREDEATAEDSPGGRRESADIGSILAVAGGVIVLVAFQLVPVLVGGEGGARTGRQVTASAGQVAILGLFWLVPVAAVVLIVLNVRRVPVRWIAGTRGAGLVVLVAGVAVLGQVVALKLLQRPVGVDAAYRAGIDPASGAGPGYWLQLGGFGTALLGGVPALLARRSGVIAGAVAGVVVGTVVSSAVLDVRQTAAQGDVVLLAAGMLGEDPFGADFSTEHPAVVPDRLLSGAVDGGREQLFAATPGRSSCRRDELAARVAEGGSEAWLFAVRRGRPDPPPTEDVRTYVVELTPVDLRADIRVTAHRFSGGHVVPYQAILQAGTTVLVDRHGVPRVRCAGATPLAPPRDATGEPHYRDPRWDRFDPGALVTVTPSAGAVRQFGLVRDGHEFRRPAGSDGSRDVELVPAKAVIDGIYTVTGNQSACDLNDCAKAMTRTWTITVTGCPDHCGVAGDDWSGSPSLVESAGTWSASGKVTDTKSFGCDTVTMPTNFALTLQVKTARVVDGVWTAEQLVGTYTKSSPGTPTPCRSGVLAWNVAGNRK